MIIKKILLFFIVMIIPVIAGANFNIENYRYFKDIQTIITKQIPFIKIDDDIYLESRLFLADLKIVRDDGKEIPFMITRDKDVSVHETQTKKVKIISHKKNEYLLDLGDDVIFHNRLKIVSDSREYLGEAKIMGSDKVSGPFKKLNLKDDQFEKFSDSIGQQDFFIEYKFNNFRYLKLSIFIKNGQFVLKDLFQVFDKVNVIKGDRRYREVEINDVDDENEQEDIFILDSGKHSVFEEKLKLNFLENGFSRSYKLFSSENIETNCFQEKCLWKKVSEGNIFKESYQEGLLIDVFDNKRFYKLVIEKKKDIKLHLVSANFESFIQKIYFLDDLDFINHSYRLYYGSTVTQTNNQKKFHLKEKDKYVPLKLSKQRVNSLFKKKNNGLDTLFIKRWYYLLIVFVLIFIFWFISKIFKERKNKDFEKEDEKYVSKL